MKHISSLILTLMFVAILFYQNSFAQDYVTYKTFTGSTDSDGWVECVTFSPDGQTLISKNFNSIHLWHVGTGKHIRTFVFFDFMLEVMHQNPTSFSLDGLPDTSREIDWKLTPPTTKTGELVYVHGNPAKQDL